MNTNHTPGPWERIGNKVFALTPNDRQEPGWPTEINRFGCYVQRENREPCGAPDYELEANARLIAASPCLLEALKYARRFLNEREHDTGFVDAAIAKATGEDAL